MTDTPLCRFCLECELDNKPFITPCKCKGSMKFVHSSCLDKWRAIGSLQQSRKCTVCKSRYTNDNPFVLPPLISIEDVKMCFIICFLLLCSIGIPYVLFSMGIALVSAHYSSGFDFSTCDIVVSSVSEHGWFLHMNTAEINASEYYNLPPELKKRTTECRLFTDEVNVLKLKLAATLKDGKRCFHQSRIKNIKLKTRLLKQVHPDVRYDDTAQVFSIRQSYFNAPWDCLDI
jgi:hypothetical protein